MNNRDVDLNFKGLTHFGKAGCHMPPQKVCILDFHSL